jgi:hypothetical protein
LLIYLRPRNDSRSTLSIRCIPRSPPVAQIFRPPSFHNPTTTVPEYNCLTPFFERAAHTCSYGFRARVHTMALNQPQGGGAHTQPSLPALPAHLQTDTHLTAHLASRFHVSLPTAQLSSHALISLNTYSTSSKGPDGLKEGSAMGGAEDMAERAFTRLGARSENQAVVFL